MEPHTSRTKMASERTKMVVKEQISYIQTLSKQSQIKIGNV